MHVLGHPAAYLDSCTTCLVGGLIWQQTAVADGCKSVTFSDVGVARGANTCGRHSEADACVSTWSADRACRAQFRVGPPQRLHTLDAAS